MAPKPLGRYRPTSAPVRPMADGGVAGGLPGTTYNIPKSSDLGTISKTNEGLAQDYLQEGTQLENQSDAYGGQYYADYGTSRDQANADIDTIRQTPGYTPGESAQINQDYSQYRTSGSDLSQRYLTGDEQSGIKGDPNAPSTKAGDMSGAIYSTLGTTANKADAAIGNEGSLMGTNLEQEQTNLNKAVDPSKLGLSSKFTGNYEMTPQQQQDIVTAAGTTVGNQYRTAASDLDRAAAAAGNTSPTAIAAAKQQLLDSSAAQSGDAMTQARIDASNAAANRLQTEEGMRLGSEQDISSREQQNASTIGTQAQEAIQRYGEQQQSEADTQRQAALQGVETGGEAAIGTSEYGDTSSSQRAAELAGNRQQTTADIQNTQFQQGVQTGQLTAGGAATVGNARRQGQQAVVGETQGQEQMGQQGQLTSQQQTIGAYGTKATAANQAQSNATTATGDTRGQGIGDKASSGLGSFIGGLEEGGVIGSDDPMAQPNDPSAYADPNNGVDGASSPQPGLGTRMKNAITDPLMGRYNPGGSNSNPIRSAVRNEVNQGIGAGVGALANALEDGGIAGDPDDNYPLDEPTPFRAMRRYGMTERPAADLELARGGYVSKPTLALVGERGPEMVVPLNRTASTKLPASTLKSAAGAIPRYRGMGPKGPGDIGRPLEPLGGRLSAR